MSYYRPEDPRANTEKQLENDLRAKYNLIFPDTFTIGLGWYPLVDSLFKLMVDAGWDRKLDCVKSKCCELCVYLGGEHTEGILQRIDNATAFSRMICEDCGEFHNLYVPRAGRALCKPCEEIGKKYGYR